MKIKIHLFLTSALDGCILIKLRQSQLISYSLITLFCYVWLHVSATSRHHQAVKNNLSFTRLCNLSLWDPTALLSTLLLSYTYVTCCKFYIKSGIM
jgi:hypothetical protein